MAHLSRCACELRRNTLHAHAAKIAVRYGHDVLPGTVVWIFKDVADIEHRPGDDLGRLEERHNGFAIPLPEPRGNFLVERDVVGATRGVGRKAQSVTSSHLHCGSRTLKRALRARGNADPAAIARFVGIAR